MDLSRSEFGGLLTMDEFDAMYPAEASKMKVVPMPTAKTNGLNTSKFNSLCQLHAIGHQFDLREVAKGCFSAKVEFGQHVMEEPGPFPSKKQAKEEICKRALPILEALPAPSKGTKRKSSGGGSPMDTELEGYSERMMTTVQDDENWVGLLQNFSQQRKTALPDYRHFEADTVDLQRQGMALTNKKFACTVQVAQAHLHVFGSEEKLFATKTEAKRHAAKDAVTWLRANEFMPATPPPPKRRKSIANSSPDEPGHTGLTPAFAESNIKETFAEKVHRKALSLEFTQPRYDSRPSVPPSTAANTDVGAFVNMWACFQEQDVDREPLLAGNVGEVRNVFGKKNAKEMCCKEVMTVLDRIAKGRV